MDWSIDRIAPLERAILRAALYEILHRPDVPDEVAIDEAVETAKVYCGAEAPAFVNGILGGVVRELAGSGEHGKAAHERAGADAAAAGGPLAAAGGGRRPAAGPTTSSPTRRCGWPASAPSLPRRRRSSSTALTRLAPGDRRAGSGGAAVTRRPPGGHAREAPAIPDDLRALVEDYLGVAALLGRAGHGGPRRGDALLAAGRRQAHPARCWRSRPRAPWAARPRRCCPPRRRSSWCTPTP